VNQPWSLSRWRPSRGRISLASPGFCKDVWSRIEDASHRFAANGEYLTRRAAGSAVPPRRPFLIHLLPQEPLHSGRKIA
jgi:hypothetical protein